MLSPTLRRSQTCSRLSRITQHLSSRSAQRTAPGERTFSSTRMAPSKKIVVCCDGTGNDSDGTLNVPTNVAKIARCLNHEGPAVGSEKQIPQLVYYQSGVGTKSSGSIGHAFDGLTGRGITENIRSAY